MIKLSIDSNDVNNLIVYFKLVEKLNNKLFLLHGVKTFQLDAFSKYYYLVDEYSDTFFRISGIGYNADKKILVSKNDGILSLSSLTNIIDLKKIITNMLKKNYSLIEKLRVYRNKAHHRPHTIDFHTIGTGNSDFTIGFNNNSKDYIFGSFELINLNIDINNLMIKLVKAILENIDAELRRTIWEKQYIHELFDQKRYEKFNELLLDKDRKYLVGFMK